MTPMCVTRWLLPALILLQVPGSLPLSGPRIVTGLEGGSVSLQCRYEEEFQANNKFWCRMSFATLCDKIVETTGSEREVRSGRVSISDHPANLTFTVTLERLALEDVGAYKCGVDTLWHGGFEPSFQVVVVMVPARTAASSPGGSTYSPGPRTSLSALTRPSTSLEDTSGPSPQPRSLLSGVHFLLLVFLKLPLFLSMFGAVLWVNRPQRRSRGAESAVCESY